ncbi:MAG: hypothetical protein HZA82_02420 [Thaumarchaeota archaeon]|nr:hypothetical protein [Nitrososphaerota archaeon]
MEITWIKICHCLTSKYRNEAKISFHQSIIKTDRVQKRHRYSSKNKNECRKMTPNQVFMFKDLANRNGFDDSIPDEQSNGSILEFEY